MAKLKAGRLQREVAEAGGIPFRQDVPIAFMRHEELVEYLEEVLESEYVRFAWAKGLSPAQVILKHALRNVMIPVVTIAGLSFGELIAFSIVTETIFQWPGMGNLLLASIWESDQPVIVTYIMLAAVIIITANIVVDMIVQNTGADGLTAS